MAPGRKTLLLIEDDRELRETVHEILAHAGYAVAAAGDGAEGLRLLHAQERASLGLVLVDLRMPVMSGFEFLDAFDRLRPAPAVPIVVMTAGTAMPKPPPAAVVGTLRKPFALEELLRVVSTHLT